MEDYSEEIKAEALLWVIKAYGDDFTSEDPEGCAVLMEAYISGYYSGSKLTTL